MPIFTLPDGRQVNLPEGMSRAEMAEALNALPPPPAPSALSRVGNALSNIPSDVGEIASGVGKLGLGTLQNLEALGGTQSGAEYQPGTLAGVKIGDYRETPKDLLKMMIGTAQLGRNAVLGPPDPNVPQSADYTKYGKVLVDSLKEHYGSLDKFAKYAEEHPVQAVMDASMLLTGGGGALANVPKMAKVGGAMSTVGTAIDPVNLAGKATQLVRYPAEKFYTGTSGFLSGIGQPQVQEALKGGALFNEGRNAVTGEILKEKVYNTALAEKSMRNVEWQGKMKELETTAGLQGGLDITPVADLADSLRAELTGSRTGVPAVLKKADMEEALTVLDTVKNFVNSPRAGELGAIDALRQTITQNLPATGFGRKIATDLKNELISTVESQVPGYQRVLADYSNKTKWITELEKDVLSGNMASFETKMRNVAKGGKETYRQLMDTIEQTNPGFREMFAGWASQPVLPQNMYGRIAGIGQAFGAPAAIAGVGGMTMGAGALAAAAPTLLMSSPRAATNIAHGYGRYIRNPVQAGVGALTPMQRLGLMQAGKYSELEPVNY